MGGTPLPPFTDKIFGKKGVTDLGGTPPPPFTDKIRKVVFEVPPNLPYTLMLFVAWLRVCWQQTCLLICILGPISIPMLRQNNRKWVKIIVTG